jgi:hypothetical protein
MSIITVDNVNYETELFSERGKGLVQALLEADVRLREATMTATLLQAATIALIEELKAEHLTEETIAPEDGTDTTTEE